MFATTNPYTQEQLSIFPSLSDKQLENKLALAKATYYNHWRLASIEERVAVVKKIENNLRSNTRMYAELITTEMGKPIQQSLAEIEKCAFLCQYFAENTATFLKEKPIQTDYQTSYVRYESLGAVMGIMPWNFPFWQAMRFAIPTVCAGNVILLKPAPNVPQCSLQLEQIFMEEAEKEGLFQTLLIETDQVEKVIAHPIVRGVALTGSDRAGASVAAIAGKHLKRCVMELGGSDAFIVLDDANLEEAASVGVQSRMNNAGQTCIAAKRFIVYETIAEAFTTYLEKEIALLKLGNPMDFTTNMGTLARPDLKEHLLQQVQYSIQKGAKIQGDDWKEQSNNFFEPMILSNLQPGMPAYEEELFGPVISLFTVKSDAESVALANSTDFGLGAAIWSQNIERAKYIADRLEVGFVSINDFVKSDPRLPFGGMKRSGFGRELAEEGIKEFVNIKTVVIK